MENMNKNSSKFISEILTSRQHLSKIYHKIPEREAEGGCGVIGAASSVAIRGKHFLPALIQMHNRGNGKGGGIAVLGLSPTIMGVSQDIMDNNYLLAIAFLDTNCKDELEAAYIYPNFDITGHGWFSSIDDHATLGLVIKPPQVYYYFVRAKPKILQRFIQTHEIENASIAEDEFVYQNSFHLNKSYYASLGEQKAFVLSHGKNLLVLKLVGYGEQVIQYYKLENFPAHVWIGHHRYPTKGLVFHPGGAHPFIGLHEALVHNGDFANYHAITDYLAQRNMYPLFLTDTEVGVYLFDLYSRVYQYPTEYLIEALAPTTERDLIILPPDKQEIYKNIQLAHLHASPDGPWFFIIGRNKPEEQALQLIGITDTSMLRPQIFALQEGEEQIGLIASERQAIDAMLYSLAQDDSRFPDKADISCLSGGRIIKSLSVVGANASIKYSVG